MIPRQSSEYPITEEFHPGYLVKPACAPRQRQARPPGVPPHRQPVEYGGPEGPELQGKMDVQASRNEKVISSILIGGSTKGPVHSDLDVLSISASSVRECPGRSLIEHLTRKAWAVRRS